VEFFGGWGKGEPGEAQGGGGPAWVAGASRWGPTRARGGEEHERERTGQGEARQVHYAPNSH